MGIENKLARLMRDTGPARFFLPLGILLIVFGIVLSGFNSENYLETTGTITFVAERLDPEKQKEYDVYFTYTADGREYEGSFVSLPKEFSEADRITVYYDPENPQTITNARTSRFMAPAVIAAGVAAIAFGALQTRKALKKSRELDKTVPGKGAPAVDFDAFKTAPGVTEYYFRYDGNTLKPGYLIEDAQRNVLYEGKMLRNALVGARDFEFSDHTTGSVSQHEIGHTVTQTYDSGFFSAKSWFKMDGKNVWDELHGRGLRMVADLHSRFPRLIYDVSRDGAAFARIESCGMYVHEEDEAQHRLALPAGKMYYRFWTDSADFDSLFLTMFALSETEQTVVE